MRFMTSENRTTVDSEGQVRRFRSGVGGPVSKVRSDILKLLAYGACFCHRPLDPAKGRWTQ